jgi:hypothetical protein
MEREERREEGREKKKMFGTKCVAFSCFFPGKLLKAEYILSSLISNNGATGEHFCFLVVLEFKLRALHLLGRHLTT